MRWLKRMETTKKVLWSGWASAIILTVLVIIGTFMEKDVTSLAVLAGEAWAVVGLVNGFYMWKAKNENRSKGAMKLIRELADQHGLESVASVLEVIFKE